MLRVARHGRLERGRHRHGSASEVLRGANALPERDRLLHGAPAPLGDHTHALVIDDHIGMAVGKSEQSMNVQEMWEAFERGAEACRQAGIPHHSGKRVRAQQNGLSLGGELVAGRLPGTERMRRAMLTVLSLTVA